jgi:dynein heavy chain 1
MLLESAVSEDKADTSDMEAFVNRSTKFTAQIMILATQINWSMGVEGMAETVLKELPPDSRKKFEQLITELVHQRDVVRNLIKDGVSSQKDFRSKP